MKTKTTAGKESHNKHSNHLANETSTYLLQHADNPVDWYPWNKTALERAISEDKPILLSIGYSACHWCHVMEHESFQDEKTAALMNEHFVCIKVDREERSDIDDIYMKAVQLMTGHGGWPITLFLTPQLKPFFGGTYFPEEDRHGLPSFKRILTGVSQAWKSKRSEIEQSAQSLTNQISIIDNLDGKTSTLGSGIERSNTEFIKDATQKILGAFDKEWGGFGTAPKFPHPFFLALGMRLASDKTNDDTALSKASLEMITTTLNRMSYGGIYDHLGGGFARYSVDRQWLTPHFEKMLYDNALLCQAYLNGYFMTGCEYWKKVALEILDFVKKELTTTDGAFYSSLDADSEGKEGEYYIWTIAEIKEVLQEDAAWFCEVFGVTAAGNFEGATNILHFTNSPEALASQYKMSIDQFWSKLEPLSKKLLSLRQKRVRPGRDEKVLTSWNSLMISAFVTGYKATGKEQYLNAAKTACEFILAELFSGKRLLRTWGAGKAKLNGYLDDYAFFSQALIDLAEVDGNPQWLKKAISLADYMLEKFRDTSTGGFFYTSDDHETLVVRPKSHFDGSIPSGSSVAAFVLIKLSEITQQESYRKDAEQIIRLYQPYFPKAPDQFANLICAYDFAQSNPSTIVVCLPERAGAGKELLLDLHRRYLPNKIVVVKTVAKGKSDSAIKKTYPSSQLLKDKILVDGHPTVYVCRNQQCLAPVTSVNQLKKQLDLLSCR